MDKFCLLFFILFAIPCNSQPEIKCNIEKVKIADQNAGNLTNKVVLDFLKTFDKTCGNNAEYLEFSNETLFKLLEADPNKIISQIDHNKKALDEDYIFLEVQNPVSDNINLEFIKERIQDLSFSCQTKNKILESIEIAIAKSNSIK